MAKPKLSSLLVIGVEWGPMVTSSRRADLDRLAGSLLDHLQVQNLKATWGLRDFDSPWVQRLRDVGVAQEIALDATDQTPQQAHEGFAFAAWLREKVRQAQDQDLGVRSLVLGSNGRVPYHAIAKVGFRTVRPGRIRTMRLAQAVRPQPLRYGLWGLPVSVHWPQPSRWLQHAVQHQAVYSLRRAAMQNAVFHVVFELSRMADQMGTSLRAGNRLLDAVASLRDQQELQVARLIDIDRLVRMATAARPTQSILRRAA